MKKCPKCNTDKSLSDFKPGKGRTDGLSSWCRSCSRQAQRDYYQKKKDQWRLDTNAKRKKIRKYIAEAKNVPCVDCGNIFQHYAMDFHHTDPTSKRLEVSQLVSCGLKTVKEEISKCIVLCSNCHRVRTFMAHSSNG